MEFEYDEAYFKQHYASPIYRWYVGLRNRFIRERVAQYVSAGTFLEIGFGDDNLLRLFADTFDIFGVDISPYAAEQVNGAYPNSHFAVCDISAGAIPFAIQFDVICAINVVEHLPAPDAGLQHIYDALAPGGVFVAYLPTESNVLSQVQYTLFYDVEEHIYRPSVPDLQAELRRLGLRRLEEYAASFIPMTISHPFTLETFNLYCGLWQKV